MVKKKLLIVDDEEDLLQLSGLVLETDFEIKTTTEGEQAIEILKEGKFIPDGILLDIVLPGIDGYEVCKWIKENIPEIKVIFFSVRGSQTDLAKGREAGAEAHIVKPTSSSEMISVIHSTLGIE